MGVAARNYHALVSCRRGVNIDYHARLIAIDAHEIAGLSSAPCSKSYETWNPRAWKANALDPPFGVRLTPIGVTLFRFAQQHAKAHACFSVTLVAELMQADQLDFSSRPVCCTNRDAR